MKRSELIISVLLALMFLTPISLKAQISFTVGDIQYWVTNVDEEVIVDKYVGSDDILTLSVPGTVTYDNQEFTVTSIGVNAFSELNSLREIILSSSVTSIGTSAFKGCTNLKKVNIPEGVTSIGDYTFKSCNLHHVTIPERVTDIGYQAFDSCIRLDTLTVLSENPPAIDDEVFDPRSGMVVFVPKGSETAYKNAEGWKDFEIKIIIENPVTSITLNTEQLTMEYGTKEQLTATVAPDDADNLGLTWTSDNEEVATVYENGLVTAVGEGTATITATANDGSGVSASCVVTVTFIDGIADVETSKVTVLAANGRITVSGKEQYDTVSVYDTVGRLLYRGESDVIDVPRKAMYIVTVSRKSYKVVVQ